MAVPEWRIKTILSFSVMESSDDYLDDHPDDLPRLVLPLAGPSPEELTDEEMEGLPMDLQVSPAPYSHSTFSCALSSLVLTHTHTHPPQYLDEDKKVEEDLDIRTMLLEALTQLCATR